MKLHHLIVFSALLGGAFTTAARAEVLDLTTVTGKTYKQCRVIQMDPDGVMFRHAAGAGKVLFKDLIKPLRDHFGFDPATLQAHEDKIKEEKAKARKLAEERARELMKQRQEAVNLALERQALFVLQQAAAVAQQYNQSYNVNNVGGFVSLGGTFDGGGYYRAGSRRSSLNWNMGCYNNYGWGGYGGFGYGFGYGQNCGNGYTPRPFFAVPGIGPNATPTSCPPRVIHGSGVAR